MLLPEGVYITDLVFFCCFYIFLLLVKVFGGGIHFEV